MNFSLDINTRRLLSEARWNEATRRSSEGHATVDQDLSFMAQLEAVWLYIEACVIAAAAEEGE